MNENEKISEERMIYLKLFDKIMRLEHKNTRTKDDSDKVMQEKIKKLIQSMVIVKQ